MPPGGAKTSGYVQRDHVEASAAFSTTSAARLRFGLRPAADQSSSLLTDDLVMGGQQDRLHSLLEALEITGGYACVLHDLLRHSALHWNSDVGVLGSRVLPRRGDHDCSRRFSRDVLARPPTGSADRPASSALRRASERIRADVVRTRFRDLIGMVRTLSSGPTRRRRWERVNFRPTLTALTDSCWNISCARKRHSLWRRRSVRRARLTEPERLPFLLARVSRTAGQRACVCSGRHQWSRCSVQLALAGRAVASMGSATEEASQSGIL